MKYSYLILSLAVAAVILTVAFTEPFPDQLATAAISHIQNDEILSTLAGMTLEEKVGQMFLYGYWGKTSNTLLKELAEKGKIGGVILLSTNVKGDVAKLTDDLQSKNPLSEHFPLLISIDEEGGKNSRINTAEFNSTTEPQIKSRDEAYNVALERGRALKKVGINVNFSPVVEHITSRASFLYPRVFRGSENDIVQFGEAMAEGYRDGGIASTVKHFPGHENTSVNSHVTLPLSSMSIETFKNFTSPFREVIRTAKPELVMTSHVLFKKIDSQYPATLSVTILSYLRGEIGFDGVLITDDMNMGAITKNFNVREAALQAVNAGNDILLYVAEPKVLNTAYAAVLEGVKSGALSEDRINESVKRILKLKKILR